MLHAANAACCYILLSLTVTLHLFNININYEAISIHCPYFSKFSKFQLYFVSIDISLFCFQKASANKTKIPHLCASLFITPIMLIKCSYIHKIYSFLPSTAIQMFSCVLQEFYRTFYFLKKFPSSSLSVGKVIALMFIELPLVHNVEILLQYQIPVSYSK